MKKLITLAVLSALGLAGCGSDSSGSDKQPVTGTPDQGVQYDNLDVHPDASLPFDGSIKVYLGPYKACGSADGFTNQNTVADGNHPYCVPNGAGGFQSGLTVDDSDYVLEIRAADIDAFMGGQSINKDLFQPGQYSMLDVLFYVAQHRDDVQMLTTDNEVITNIDQLEFDDEIGTYRFHMSWDRNKDGLFNEKDNVAGAAGTGSGAYIGDGSEVGKAGYDGWGEEDNFQSPHWYGRFTYYAGDFLREGGLSTLETIYDRLDEFLVKNNTYLRFESFDPRMTERREASQKAQVERKHNGGGTDFQVDFNEGNGLEEIVSDIVVTKAYNMRQDIYKPDTLSAMDVLMTAHQAGLAEIRYSYWPTLSTRANVGSYAVHKVGKADGSIAKRTAGTAGWVDLRIGEKANLWDFKIMMGPPIYFNTDGLPGSGLYGRTQFKLDKPETYESAILRLVELSKIQGNKVPGALTPCTFLTDENGHHDFDSARLCVDEWGNAFGGTYLHQMTDTWSTNYPPEVITLKHDGHFQLLAWDATEKNNVWETLGDGGIPGAPYDNENDVKHAIYDLSGKLVAPMDDSHFGWGIADCGLCHSLDNIHKGAKGGDSPALPDQVQPHFCASCHGNNGAPQGHGEIANCYWCHSVDKMPANHGDATLPRPLSEVQCKERPNYLSAMTWNNDMGPCAHKTNIIWTDSPRGSAPMPPMLPHDQAGNYMDYPANQMTQGNSFWHTSETMPDPYSCLTCHANPAE